MVDPVSGSGGVPPVKQANKAVAPSAAAEKSVADDSVEISDDAIILAQASKAKGQLVSDPAAVLSNNSEVLKSIL